MSLRPKNRQPPRHTPGYILLLLAKHGDLYGSAISNLMKEELPFCLVDGATIYRTMSALEKDGSVESYWETDTPGPAKKWYKITKKGMELLSDFEKDIEMRKKNFEFFLKEYREVKKKKPD